MSLNKRIVWFSVCLMLLSALLFSAWWFLQHKGNVDPSEPVALVNGAPIALKTLEREMRKIRDDHAMQGLFPEGEQLAALRKETLDRLIETELLWQHSTQEGILVTDEAVATELEEMKRQYINEAIFAGVLKSAGLTEAEVLPLIRKDLAVQAWVEREIAGTITVSPEEKQSFYQENAHHFEIPEQVRANQICVYVDADADGTEAAIEAARAAMEALRQRILAGEPFAEVAEEASHCGGLDSGGDMGFITRGSMEEVIEEAAFATEVNALSPIVQSSRGFHLLEVTDRQPARVMPFEEVEQHIETHLRDRKIHEAVADRLAQLRTEADIHIQPSAGPTDS